MKCTAILLATVMAFTSCNNEEQETKSVINQSTSEDLCELKYLSKQKEGVSIVDIHQ